MQTRRKPIKVRKNPKTIFRIPNAVIVEALASGHDHFREEDGEQDAGLQEGLVLNSLKGGMDTVGTMPNTKEGLKTAKEVVPYNDRIIGLIPSQRTLNVVRYVAITESTTEQMIDDCMEAGIRDGKVLPKNRTTLSRYGVVRYGKLLPIVKHCGKVGMRVHGHMEHPSKYYTNDDAEWACLTIVREWLEETDAIIVWEHGTEGRCVPHWIDMATSNRFFVTLTPQHLLLTADDVYGAAGEICKPSYGDPFDLEQLNGLVDMGFSWVMAGPDVAVHRKGAKHPPEGKCACGAYHAPFLHPLYAHALQRLFRTPEGIEKYIDFTSRNLRRLHGLPDASRMIKLVKEEHEIPFTYQVGTWEVQPFWAGKKIGWSIDESFIDEGTLHSI